jgi:uncharacterized membrane protein YdbT with pleckstrin-like domain
MPRRVLFTVQPKMFRAHPFIYLSLIGAILLFLLEVLVGVENAVGQVIQEGSPVKRIVSGAGKIGLGVSIFAMFAWWIKNHYTRLIVTQTHAKKKTGIVSNRSSQLRHKDIKNIQVDQGPIQYILGTGTLQLSSAGQAAEEIVITDIPDPEQVQSDLSRQRGEVVQNM